MSSTIILNQVFLVATEGNKAYVKQPVLIAWGTGCIATSVMHHQEANGLKVRNWGDKHSVKDERHFVDASSPVQTLITLPNKEKLEVEETINEIAGKIKTASLHPQPKNG